MATKSNSSSGIPLYNPPSQEDNGLPEDGEYRSDEFLIPSSGPTGQSTVVSFRMLPELERQVDLILISRKFPYVTRGDLYRHALFRHIKWLSRLQRGLLVNIPVVEAAQQILRDSQIMTSFKTALDDLGRQVDELIAVKREDKARELVSGIWLQIKRLEDETWKRHYTEIIEAKYGNLLPSGGGISLLPSADLDSGIEPDGSDG